MPVQGFLKHFRDEFEYHIEHKQCLVRTSRHTAQRQTRHVTEADGMSQHRNRRQAARSRRRQHHGHRGGQQAGIYIPHFCYHKKLSIAANCRMCLVQVEKAPKPLPACATPVTEGMKVFTHSDAADQGAEGRDGVPADQPSARLPDLRPGRRVPAAGSGGRLRRRRLALPAKKSAWC